jgi:hypothetical protein
MATVIINKMTLKLVREATLFELTKQGKPYNPQVVEVIIDVAFKEAEKIGMIDLVGDDE